MKSTDFTNNGGMPLTQNRLAFMQDGYNEMFGAIAKLCGDKVILYGVVKTGSVVSDGWIAYGGELIRFIGGAYAADVVISEAVITNLPYADNNSRNIHFDKTATCGASGAFPFSDLMPLVSIQSMVTPGTLKLMHVDNAYIAANFDGSGIGTNAETGWKILSAEYPNAAGKALVNLDPGDATFDTVGNHGGEKTHTLTVPEMPAHTHGYTKPHADGSATGNANNHPDGPLEGANTASTGGGGAHNNLQPYYVILTLIKL